MNDAAALTATDLISIAMIIFMTVFLCVVLWIVFARRDAFTRQAQLPLHDDHPENTPHSSTSQERTP